MNKRMKKKHESLGVKRVAANYYSNEIFRHILRKMKDSGIPLKPCYIRNAKSYVRWFFHNSSEEEWLKRAADTYPSQIFLSTKQLLPGSYLSVYSYLKEFVEKVKAGEEKLLSGDMVDKNE